MLSTQSDERHNFPSEKSGPSYATEKIIIILSLRTTAILSLITTTILCAPTGQQ